MKLEKFLKLSQKQQEAFAWEASETEQKEVRKEFLRIYRHPKIKTVTVGAYGLGPLPCVFVEITNGKDRLSLPKEFMGHTVIKRYLSNGKIVY